MSELTYNLDRDNLSSGTATIHFGGSIDPNTMEQFQEGMNEALKAGMDNSCANIVVNFKDLTYINSSGLRVILTTTKTAISSKIAVKFVELDEEVYKIFEQVGYCRIFDINKA